MNLNDIAAALNQIEGMSVRCSKCYWLLGHTADFLIYDVSEDDRRFILKPTVARNLPSGRNPLEHIPRLWMVQNPDGTACGSCKQRNSFFIGADLNGNPITSFGKRVILVAGADSSTWLHNVAPGAAIIAEVGLHVISAYALLSGQYL